MILFSMTACHGAEESVWAVAPPDAPGNISVTVRLQTAEIRWLPGSSGKGNLPTHYVVKWQAKGHDEVIWYPNFVGVGGESIQVHGLYPGWTYAVRVAAVNTQGRAWSPPAVFHALGAISCAETNEWEPLIDDDDEREICSGAYDAIVAASDDPDARRLCDPGVTEYVLAGVAAGGTIALVAFAVLLRHPAFQHHVVPQDHGAGEELTPACSSWSNADAQPVEEELDYADGLGATDGGSTSHASCSPRCRGDGTASSPSKSSSGNGGVGQSCHHAGGSSSSSYSISSSL